MIRPVFYSVLIVSILSTSSDLLLIYSLRVAVDARDKLIDSRRTVDDARTVIRQNVVAKVGDLRTVLNPKRGVAVRGRGRGRGGR